MSERVKVLTGEKGEKGIASGDRENEAGRVRDTKWNWILMVQLLATEMVPFPLRLHASMRSSVSAAHACPFSCFLSPFLYDGSSWQGKRCVYVRSSKEEQAEESIKRKSGGIQTRTDTSRHRRGH